MIRWQKIHPVFVIYSLLISTSAFISAFAFLMISAGSENNIILGLSLQRLVLIVGILLAGIFMFFVALKAYRNQAWTERTWDLTFGSDNVSKKIRWTAAIGSLSSWIILFTPVYRFGAFQEYIIRLFPLINFLLVASVLTFIVATVEKYETQVSFFLGILRAQKKVLLIALIIMMLFLLIWSFVVVTGMGVTVTDGFWYPAGVPILGLQIVFAFAIGIGIFFLERSSLSNHLPKREDILVFFLLWGVAAFLWVREPLPSNFFGPGPYSPSFEYYPYSDAATFDIGSQFALIGQGINNGVFFDRALYMAFLVYLHAFAGQDYSQIVAIQAAIYAVFPAILYLLGKAIHSRSFGVILAVLATLRGINGIAASAMIDLSNQKQMLTDFPTVIFVAWFTLMIVKWLQAPNKKYLNVLWAGGIVGLAVMVRTNVLFLALFAVILIVFVYWRQKSRGVIVGFLFAITMFASTFAWGAYNDRSVFDVYMYRIRIVLDARYPHPATPAPASPQGEIFSPFIFTNQNHEIASSDPDFGAPVQLVSSLHPVTAANSESPQSLSVFSFVSTHFLHNVIMSVFILPVTPAFHDLRNTVKETEPFWQLYWNGSISTSTGFFLMLNLALIALGIAVSWNFSKLSGVAPLGVFIFYNLANALARTSGGRYLVPMDWIVLFYFALGLLQTGLWAIKLFEIKTEHVTEEITGIRDTSIFHAPWTWVPIKKTPWIMILFLCIGSALPLSDNLFLKQYFVRSQSEQFDMLEKDGYLQKMGFDKAEIQNFSEQWPSFRVVSGRALYPRFFAENKGLPKKRFPYSELGFPRIAFTMIGPEGMNYVLLPEADVPFFPNASDVIVLGCQDGANLDALAVVVIKEQVAVYTRLPASPLQCPLKEPVCDNNHVCR